MKRIAIYVRVSTQEQKKHGLSVDNQIQALREWIKENGYIEVGLYNDAGISARKRYTRRPALLQLINDCQQGKIDLIIFTKLDRWFRSVGDYYEVQRQLDQYKVPWRAIWEDYETETSSGIFKVNIMLSVAQSEADRTSERLKSTFAYKKERGDATGSAPIGYKIKGREMVKDTATEQGIQALFDTYLDTYSIIKSVKAAADYGALLNRNHAYAILRNKTYSGEATCGINVEPYISKEQHQVICEILKKRGRQSKFPKQVFKFGGLCKCGYCGHNMISKTIRRVHSDGTEVYHKKYVCDYTRDMHFRCPSLQISEPNLEAFLLANLDNIIKDQIESAEFIQSQIPDYEKKKKSLNAKLSRLAILFEEGDISVEDYRSKKNIIKLELDNLEPVTAAVPTLPDNWHDIYNELDDEHKRLFWLKTIKTITVTNENKKHPAVTFL